MGLVPSVVVIDVGIILYRLAPISRMECDTVVRIDFINRYPPIQLRLRGRIPGITMWMPGVGNTSREVIITGGASEARHIKVSLLGITPVFLKNVLNVLFRLGVMDKFRLQTGENCSIFLDGQAVLRFKRISSAELFLNHFTGEITKLQRRRRR